MESRIAIIMKTSIIGIVVNVFLAVFKMVIGLVTKSVAILSDGVNNFADAASSIITIVGAKLAGKRPDKKHPFGHGRMEYLSALVIAGVVLYAGVTALVSAIQSIIHPEAAEYSALTLIIVAVAVVIKLVLALFTVKQGKKANSDSLVAGGKEALLDVLVSVATLVAALVFVLFHISLEAYLAAIISILIIKTGIETLMETVSKILGEPADINLVIEMKKTMVAYDGVYGVYDVVLNNYGPEIYMASAHIEVDGSLPARELDTLIRNVTDAVLKEQGIYLTAVGIYARNAEGSKEAEIEKKVKDIVNSIEFVKGAHGFYLDEANKKMSFDAVISFDAGSRQQVYEEVVAKVQAQYPDYELRVGSDMDMNELNR